jgi:hypothetical protein
MSANGFNVGRDLTLDIVDPVQGVVRFKILTDFDHAPIYKSLESHALDGEPRFAELPAGHDLKFGFDRADSTVDDYFCAQEVNYFSGQPVTNVSIIETITEVSGAVTSYRFTRVAMKLSNGGKWKGDSIVTQGIDAKASRRIKAS